MQKVLHKKNFNKFMQKLIDRYEVIAPVKKEITKFAEIENPDEICLDNKTLMPPKKFFFPENEILLEFNGTKIKETNGKKEKNKKRIIFGLARCDLNAIKLLDKVMHDSHYIKKRRNTIVIGMHCKPDKYCFCNSMELEDVSKCSDLFFYPKGRKYYISVFTRKGEKIVRDLPDSKKEIILKIKNRKKLPDKDIEKDYKNEIWNTDVEKCLSCGACTAYCPTCNCFDIEDKLNIDMKSGKRMRKETSCQLKSFSRVAGGKVFRESRESRFKHFVYHKIAYFKNQFNKYMCVGCGRCLRVCPTNIDWVETINILNSNKKRK